MALAPVFYALLFLIHLAQAAIADELPRELSNLIPGCAEKCFLSFLDVHFDDDSDCSETLSLRCICSTPGLTEFTVGEGAVQCLTAETRFGTCTDFSASDRVLSAAYRMCDNQPNAIQPTHEVITASLILPSSSGDVVKFPPVTSSSPSPSQEPLPTTLPTTLVTDTELPPPIPSPTTTRTTTTRDPPQSSTDVGSTLITTTRAPTQDTTIGSPTETETEASPPPAETDTNDDDENGDAEADEDEDEDGAAPLTTPQIAGVSVGVAAAGAIAILAIVLSRRCRRRNHPGIKTGFLPRHSTWGYSRSNNGRTASTHSWIANQIRAPLDIDVLPPPPAYPAGATQERWNSGNNGLGLTIESSPPPPRKPESDIGSPPAPQYRRLSKLLPAKPEMTPTPTGSGWQASTSRSQPLSQQTQQMQQAEPSSSGPLPGVSSLPQGSNLSKPVPAPGSQTRPPVTLKLQIPPVRDLTKAPAKSAFPRDSNITQFEEDSLLSPEGQIWRPPSSAPLTAIPCYVADKNGNWVLASPTKDWPANPTDSFTSKPAAIGAALTTPANTVAQPNYRGSGTTMSRGGLSARTSLAPAARITRYSDASSTLRHSLSVYSQHSSVPRPLFYSNSRQSSAPPHPAPTTSWSRPDPPLRNISDESDETIFENSSSGDSKGPTPPEIRRGLTPVVESPFANNGIFAGAPGAGAGAGIAPGAKAPDTSGHSGLGLDLFPKNNTNARPRFNTNHPPPVRAMQYFPPGQPSPTLGLMNTRPPPSGGPGGGMSSSNNVPTNGRRPMNVVGANQPATMRVVEPSPEPEENRPAHAGRLSQPYSFDGPYPNPRPLPSNLPPSGPTPRPNIAGSQPAPERYNPPRPSYAPPQNQHWKPPHPFQYGLPPGPRPQPQPHQQPHQRSPHPRPLQPPSLNTQLPLVQRPHVDFQSPASERTVSSTASSLLAKRLGSDRAAQMAMPINASASQQKWHRDGFLSPQPMTPKMPADLPSTPTWVPKLTPTRRGDDLFLNVQ